MSTTTAQPSLSERVAGAIFWNTLAFPVKAVIKFSSGLVILWALSRDQYGVFQATLGSLVATMWIFTGLGISASILKFVPEVMERQGVVGVGRFLRTLFALRLTLLLAVVVGLNLYSGAVVNFFNLGANGLFLLRAGSALVLMRAGTDTCTRVLTAYFKQKATNTLDIVSTMVQPLLIIVLVPGGWGLGWGIRGAAIALLAGAGLDLFLAVLTMRRALQRLPTRLTVAQPVERLWQRFRSNALMNYVMDLSINITSPDFVALLLLWLARPGDLADIEAGWNQVIVLLTYLVLPLNGIYVPMFSEIFARRDDHKLQPAYATLTRALLLATVPAGVGFITLAPQAFTLLNLADKYPQAAASAQLLTFFLFAESIVVVPHVILMVYERYRVVMASRLLAVLSAPLIVWVVTETRSPIYAALSIGFLRLASRAVLTPYAARKFGLRFPWRFCARLLVPSLVFAVVLRLLDEYLPVLSDQAFSRNAWHLGALIAIGITIFAVGFKALGGLDADDRARLATMRIPFRKLMLRYL